MGDQLNMTEDNLNRKYVLRQLLVNTGVWTAYFMFGIITGAPTVLVPQLRHEANSSDVVTVEQASWLVSIHSYTGMPWVFLLPLMSAFFGRKIIFTFVCLTTLIGFVIFYCSSNVYHIIISEVVQGVLAAFNLTITIVICTEYTSPKYRGIFLTIKSASFYSGILAANTIGTFFHWKNIPLCGLFCNVYCLATAYFWPESPLWLVKKGHIDKCKHSHRWLKGSSSEAEKELQNLINREEQFDKKISLKLQWIDSLKSLLKKQFYKTYLLICLVLSSHILSGKLIFSMYAIEVFKKMSSDKSTVYFSMIIADVITVISMYVGCGLAKLFKRRTLLLTFLAMSEIFLFTLSVYLYLVKLSVTSETIYVSLPLFLGFSVATSCGPLIFSTTIAGELLPIESRNIAVCLTALTFKLMYGTLTKVFPYILHSFGMHGTFFFFSVSSTTCLVLIYFYLPETKDKTMQEINENVNGIKSSTEVQELLPISSYNDILKSK